MGGNQRFFEFLREYGNERDPISKKYSCNVALFYRRRLCAQAKQQTFTERTPAKSAQELADNALAKISTGTGEVIGKTGQFFSETDQKYKISQKTSEGITSAKVGFMSLWGRAKTLV